MQTFSDDLQAVSSVGGKDQLGSLSSWLVEVETSLEDCHLRRLESLILYFSLLRRSPENSETFCLGLSWSSGGLTSTRSMLGTGLSTLAWERRWTSGRQEKIDFYISKLVLSPRL